MKESFDIEVNGKSYHYVMKENVPCSSLLAAIRDAVDMCYAEDGTFLPEMEDFAIEYMILATLTDLELPASVDEAYPFIREIDGLPSADADFIADGVRANLAYRARMETARLSSAGADRVANTMEDTLRKFAVTADAITSLIEQLGDMAKKADLSDIDDIVKAVAHGQLDEKKMVNAILDFQEAKKAAEKRPVKPRAKKPVAKKVPQ